MTATRARYRALSEEEQKIARNIGNQISKARIEQEISQTELGKLASINQTTISNIETGKTLPNIASLMRIASVLHKKLEIEFEES